MTLWLATGSAAKSIVIKIIKARPLLSVSTLAGALTAVCLPYLVTPSNNWVTLIVSWNVGSVMYLILALKMMLEASPARVRMHAISQDAGNYIILSLVILSAIICLIANVMVLGISQKMEGEDRVLHIGLAALTIASSWIFTQVMFAIHYAHDYFSAQQMHKDPGLLFPGTEPPDYLDFLYFAAIIGTSGQTADVSVTTRSMRRLALIHCIMAFFFNTTLIALTINIAAGFI